MNASQIALEKKVTLSLLRDFFAAAVMAGIQASYTEGYPTNDFVTTKSFEVADEMLKLSKTPSLIKQLEKI